MNFYCSPIKVFVLWFSREGHCVTRSHSLMISSCFPWVSSNVILIQCKIKGSTLQTQDRIYQSERTNPPTLRLHCGSISNRNQILPVMGRWLEAMSYLKQIYSTTVNSLVCFICIRMASYWKLGSSRISFRLMYLGIICNIQRRLSSLFGLIQW